MIQVIVQCNACGFNGVGVVDDEEELEGENDAAELEDETKDCPRCGAALKNLDEDKEDTREPAKGVVPFEPGDMHGAEDLDAT